MITKDFTILLINVTYNKNNINNNNVPILEIIIL